MDLGCLNWSPGQVTSFLRPPFDHLECGHYNSVHIYPRKIILHHEEAMHWKEGSLTTRTVLWLLIVPVTVLMWKGDGRWQTVDGGLPCKVFQAFWELSICQQPSESWLPGQCWLFLNAKVNNSNFFDQSLSKIDISKAIIFFGLWGPWRAHTPKLLLI